MGIIIPQFKGLLNLPALDRRKELIRRTGFLVPLLYGEISNDVPTHKLLAALVRQQPWQEVVARAAGVPAISWQEGVEEPSHQLALAAAMMGGLIYGPPLISRLRGESNRTLFTREGLLAVLRIAIVEASEGNPEANFADCFTRAVLVANSLLMDEITPPEAANKPVDLLASELRSALLWLENVHDLLARSNAFIEWSSTTKAQNSKYYLPVEDDFKRFTGLTPTEFAAGAYLALTTSTRFKNWDDLARLGGLSFNLDELLASFKDQRVARQWFQDCTVPMATVKSEWQKEESLSFAAAGSLWRQPVVQTDDGRYFIPSPALVWNTMGDGVYFRLFDGYGDENPNDDSKKLRFTQFYGEFLEDYVVERFAEGYGKRDDVWLHREHEYQRGVKSSDLFVREANNVILIEVVNKRMNLRASVLRLDRAKIDDDLQKGVVDKAWQLHRNVEDFRAGTLFPEVPRSSGQRIFPVLVAPHDWPRVYLLTEMLKNAQEKEGLLKDAEPIEMIDVDEVEALEPGLSAGVRFAELLDRKNRSDPHNRLMSLHNYLFHREPTTLPNIPSPMHKRGGELAQGIIKLVQTWAKQ